MKKIFLLIVLISLLLLPIVMAQAAAPAQTQEEQDKAKWDQWKQKPSATSFEALSTTQKTEAWDDACPDNKEVCTSSNFKSLTPKAQAEVDNLNKITDVNERTKAWTSSCQANKDLCTSKNLRDAKLENPNNFKTAYDTLSTAEKGNFLNAEADDIAGCKLRSSDGKTDNLIPALKDYYNTDDIKNKPLTGDNLETAKNALTYYGKEGKPIPSDLSNMASQYCSSALSGGKSASQCTIDGGTPFTFTNTDGWVFGNNGKFTFGTGNNAMSVDLDQKGIGTSTSITSNSAGVNIKGLTTNSPVTVTRGDQNIALNSNKNKDTSFTLTIDGTNAAVYTVDVQNGKGATVKATGSKDDICRNIGTITVGYPSGQSGSGKFTYGESDFKATEVQGTKVEYNQNGKIGEYFVGYGTNSKQAVIPIAGGSLEITSNKQGYEGYPVATARKSGFYLYGDKPNSGYGYIADESTAVLSKDNNGVIAMSITNGRGLDSMDNKLQAAPNADTTAINTNKILRSGSWISLENLDKCGEVPAFSDLVAGYNANDYDAVAAAINVNSDLKTPKLVIKNQYGDEDSFSSHGTGKSTTHYIIGNSRLDQTIDSTAIPQGRVLHTRTVVTDNSIWVVGDSASDITSAATTPIVRNQYYTHDNNGNVKLATSDIASTEDGLTVTTPQIRNTKTAPSIPYPATVTIGVTDDITTQDSDHDYVITRNDITIPITYTETQEDKETTIGDVIISGSSKTKDTITAEQLSTLIIAASTGNTADLDKVVSEINNPPAPTAKPAASADPNTKPSAAPPGAAASTPFALTLDQTALVTKAQQSKTQADIDAAVNSIISSSSVPAESWTPEDKAKLADNIKAGNNQQLTFVVTNKRTSYTAGAAPAPADTSSKTAAPVVSGSSSVAAQSPLANGQSITTSTVGNMVTYVNTHSTTINDANIANGQAIQVTPIQSDGYRHFTENSKGQTSDLYRIKSGYGTSSTVVEKFDAPNNKWVTVNSKTLQ